MNTHRTQSKSPKPLTPQQEIDLFERKMRALGFDVRVEYSSGSPYIPTINLEIWHKRKEATS